MGKAAKIGGIIAIVIVFLVVAVVVYEPPTESNTNEEKTSGVGDPYWVAPIDSMQDKVVDTFIDPPTNCDPSYPGVCIPTFPPDLDCDEIQYTNFRVLPPDRHGFDRDKDGIGCES